MDVTADKISAFNLCPRRYDNKFNQGIRGNRFYWRMREEAFRDMLDVLIAETTGAVGVLLAHDIDDVKQRAHRSLTAVQLRYGESIPLSYLYRFIDDFEMYWNNLKTVLAPYAYMNMSGRREYKIKLPDLSKSGIEGRYTLVASSDFSVVSPEINMVLSINFTKKPFKISEKNLLRLVNYIYYLESRSTPDYIGMLYISKPNIKFLEPHFFKEDYLLSFKKEIASFIKGLCNSEFKGVYGKHCEGCSYANSCPEYAENFKFKNVNYDTEVDLTVLV